MNQNSTNTVAKETVSKSMTLGEIVSQFPQAIETIQAFGLSCVGCGVSYQESLEDSAKVHGFSDQRVNDLVLAINKQIKDHPLPQFDGKERPLVTLTEKAAAKVKELQEKQQIKAKGLRFGAVPGGCSGYSYSLVFEEEPLASDVQVESHGVTVFIDPNQVPLLQGTIVDFVDALQGSGFKIMNPNAKSSCGCGQSFS